MTQDPTYGPRFRLLNKEQAKEADVPGEYWEDPYLSEYTLWLVEFDANGIPTRILGDDGGEPEDQTFGRDWKWVVDELNKLVDEAGR